MTTKRQRLAAGATSSTGISTKIRNAPSTDPVTAFARDVIAGRRLSCKLVRKACERHIADLAEGPKRGLRWDPAAAVHKLAFFRFLRHTKGAKFAGKRITLEPWEQFALGCVYGWKRADGRRRFRTAYLEIPKKNGKSLICSGVALIALVADREPGAEVYATAKKKDQARIVFGEARKMVLASPELLRKISPFKNNLSVDRTGSKFEPLASDEKSADGLNPSCVIVDELHRQKSAALRNLMDSGMVARDQPLIWIITTAGDTDPASAYAIENKYAIEILEGTQEDDTYFALIATIDDPEKWDDPGEWAKANLNIGVSVQLDDLARLATAAKAAPTKKRDFLRYHLNVRQSDASRAIDMDVWAANAGEPIDVEALKGRSCFMAFDLSGKQDLTATVKLFPPVGDEGQWIIVPRFWTPADTVDKRSERDRFRYDVMISDGWIEPVPGNIIDHDPIRKSILQDARDFEIEALLYDPWNATQLAVDLIGEGLPAMEFIQGLRSYTLPTQTFLDWLVARRFRHGGNPVLRWMASNLMVQKDKNENSMPHKAKSTGRIDGLTAAIMALGAALAGESGEGSLDDFLAAPITSFRKQPVAGR
jgi:phage terminase large subunit-like protein